MRGNTTRIILKENLSSNNKPKINSRHYSPKSHFTH